MENINRPLRRGFWWIFVWMGLFELILVLAVVFGNLKVLSMIRTSPNGPALIASLKLDSWLLHYPVYLVPGFLAVSLLFSFFAWAGVKRVVRRFLDRELAAAPPKKAKKGLGEAPEDRPKTAREIAQDTERQSLHLLALLQREGRLMDFLAEDLTLYDDAQIGGAVRAVHEGCRKLLEKRLKPVPVMAAEEGEAVTIEPGFDPAAIRLSGNVAGDPPFKGVLRHKSWKASRDEMPELISASDPRIIAPAEVDI